MSDYVSPGMQLSKLEPEVRRYLSDEVAPSEQAAFECLELCSKLMDVGLAAVRQQDGILHDMIRERVGKLQRKFGWLN